MSEQRRAGDGHAGRRPDRRGLPLPSGSCGSRTRSPGSTARAKPDAAPNIRPAANRLPAAPKSVSPTSVPVSPTAKPKKARNTFRSTMWTAGVMSFEIRSFARHGDTVVYVRREEMEQARSPRPLFFFSGVLLIYAVSGFMLNHKQRFQFRLFGAPDRAGLRTGDTVRRAGVDPCAGRGTAPARRRGGQLPETLLSRTGPVESLYPGRQFADVDLASGHAVYESIRKRPVLSSLNRLHYNPSRWWTVFSDVFLAGLIVIVLSGLVMMRGPKGLRGRGGVELIAGILIPLLFIFLT